MIAPPPCFDRELLAAFVKNADGAAFATLTERHLGFVYGVACRRTGSREMAQEAAQNAFCRLARQASALLPSMREGVSLGPWLHAVALREAGTLMRAEAVQQRALRRLADSTPAVSLAGSAPVTSPPGSEHLDDALAALPEAARRVLILRFLQGMSLREVAIEENTSEEAARKRVTRALERLTRLLARRGVTAAGVTACLAAAPLLLWPAPSSAAALAARAVKQAAAPAAGAGLSGLAGFALSQWPVAAVFLCAAVPAAWPWGRAPGGDRVDVPSRQKLPATPSAVGSGNAGELGQTGASASQPVIAGLQVGLGQFLKGGWEHRDMHRRSGNRISRLGFDEWKVDSARLAAVRSAVMDFSLEEVKAAAALPDYITSGLISSALYARWAELEPDAALKAAQAFAEKNKSPEALLGALGVIALTDPAGAVLQAWERVPEAGANGAPGTSRKDVIQALLAPLRASDPKAYVRLLTTPPLSTKNILSETGVISSTLPFDPAGALEALRAQENRGALDRRFAFRDYTDPETLQPAEVETMASFAADLPADSVLRRECLRIAGAALAQTSPERAVGLMSSGRPADPDLESEWRSRTAELLRNWTDNDPAAAARWMGAQTELDPDELSALARLAGLPAPSLAIPNPPSTAAK